MLTQRAATEPSADLPNINLLHDKVREPLSAEHNGQLHLPQQFPLKVHGAEKFVGQEEGKVVRGGTS